MLYKAVPCQNCGRNILIDGSKVVPVGGGATLQSEFRPPEERESSVICPDCRCTTRFSDSDIVEVDSTAN
jgi:hypothetical protein